MGGPRTVTIAAVGALLASSPVGPVHAQVGKSLSLCQKAVATGSGKYIRSHTGAVGKCLQAISTGVVRGGATPAEAATSAAPLCAASLRRLVNSDAPSAELGRVFEAKVDARCDPAVNPKLPHTEADIVTVGAATVSAAGLGAFCGNFGGDGEIDSYAEWRDCLRTAAQCQARQAISVQWPRALEYFEALEVSLASLPPGAVRDDALAALASLDTAIEGIPDDNRPGIVCGGNLDGTPLASELAGCRERILGTVGPGPCPDAPYGQDAMIRAGQPRAYRDNGDGTISDLATGLMWEKLGDDDSIHDQDDAYTWPDAFAQKIAGLNAGAGFAGHTDWRLPNRRELGSLAHPAFAAPAVHPAFRTDCAPACMATTCSCTASLPYWTSTSLESTPTSAWQADFADGSLDAADKSSLRRVRAVRTGR